MGREQAASSITDAAYRFARHEPAVDVLLFGTGDPDHLRANLASLLAPPLPLADRLTLTKLFGRLSGVGLDPLTGSASPKLKCGRETYEPIVPPPIPRSG
jgi:hypothetical protein